MATPTTIVELLTIPGWEPIYLGEDYAYTDHPVTDGATPIGARYRMDGHHVGAAYDAEGEQSGWCSISGGRSITFGDADEQSAVEWLLGMRALIEHVAATTIAELAARPAQE